MRSGLRILSAASKRDLSIRDGAVPAAMSWLTVKPDVTVIVQPRVTVTKCSGSAALPRPGPAHRWR